MTWKYNNGVNRHFCQMFRFNGPCKCGLVAPTGLYFDWLLRKRCDPKLYCQPVENVMKYSQDDITVRGLSLRWTLCSGMVRWAVCLQGDTALWSTWGRLQGQPSYLDYEPVNNNKELGNATPAGVKCRVCKQEKKEGYWFPWGHSAGFHDGLACRAKCTYLFHTFYFSLAFALSVTTPNK